MRELVVAKSVANEDSPPIITVTLGLVPIKRIAVIPLDVDLIRYNP